MNYYHAIAFLDFSVVILMTLVIMDNKNLTVKRKESAILAIALLFLINVSEGIEVMLGGKLEYSFLIKCVKCIELSVTPIIPLLCVYTIFALKERIKGIRFVIAIIIVHTIIEVISIWYPIVFTVTPDGYYKQLKYHWIYGLVVVGSVVFLLWKAYKFSKWYQNQNLKLLVAMFLLMTMGVMVQIMDNTVKIGCITANIASVFIYIYYNHVVTSVDKLTTLLNQDSYHINLRNVKYPAAVVLFDVDDFKGVNDNYGHAVGDLVLKKVGKTIKKCYADFGLCYRIGGDEFCCIIHKNLEAIEELNDKFLEMMEQIRSENRRMPHVSIGVEWYNGEHQTIEDIVKKADNNMYESKRNGKKIREE